MTVICTHRFDRGSFAHSECHSYLLNKHSRFSPVWTSNTQSITTVHMEPIVSKPCHFKLNPNDLRVVENKLNELKHAYAAKSSPADTISEGGTAGLTKDNIEKVPVKDLQHELDARGQPTGGLRPAPRTRPCAAPWHVQ